MESSLDKNHRLREDVKMIKNGSLAGVIKRITGMVSSHEVGTELLVISVYGNKCTVEKPEGGGTVIGVPLSYLELISPIKGEWVCDLR